MNRIVLAVGVLTTQLVTFAQPYQPPPPMPPVPTVQAAGSAVVTTKPDQARIDIGVVNQAVTAQQAGADNARQFASVVAELKKALGDKGDIQTVSYGISPNYRFPREGGSPTITGYTATNIVRVTTNDVELTGKIVDAASRVGANSVRAIDFGLRDEQAFRGKALAAAARNARANAEAIAAGLGKQIRQVLRVQDNSQGEVRPMQESRMMMAQAADAAAPPTQFMPGNIRIEVSVTLTAELGN